MRIACRRRSGRARRGMKCISKRSARGAPRSCRTSEMQYIGALAQGMQPRTQQWVLIGAIVAVLLIILIVRSKARTADGSPRLYRREIDSANKKTQEIQ